MIIDDNISNNNNNNSYSNSIISRYNSSKNVRQESELDHKLGGLLNFKQIRELVEQTSTRL